MAIRILVVDDNAAFRESLRGLLESCAHCEVCGEAKDGLEGVEKNRLLKPKVIIMDQSMPRLCGIEAAREILKEFPNAAILLLTLYWTKPLAEEARKIGIRATFSKADTSHLLEAIGVLHSDEAYIGSGCQET